MQGKEVVSFIPLVKYPYTPSPEELKAAETNFDQLKDFKGQVISSYGLLNVTGEFKLIEVIAVNTNTNYLLGISKLEDIANIFGWRVFITLNPVFGNPLI
jgi:hypothetical protein